MILFLSPPKTAPRQNNDFDCGVFVCRFAYGIFQLRHLKFTYRDAGIMNKNKEKSITDKEVFSNLITNGSHFKFNGVDIQRIRNDFHYLIENLAPFYKQAIKDRRNEKKKINNNNKKRGKK